jgi:acyl-CoA thioesterase II
MSDINLFGTMAKSIGIKTRLRALSSLQHSMQFFKNDFDLMQPILFFIQSQLIIGERGTVIGRFYSQSGTLLASVLQEGLVRLSEDTNTTSSKL